MKWGKKWGKFAVTTLLVCVGIVSLAWGSISSGKIFMMMAPPGSWESYLLAVCGAAVGAVSPLLPGTAIVLWRREAWLKAVGTLILSIPVCAYQTGAIAASFTPALLERSVADLNLSDWAVAACALLMFIMSSAVTRLFIEDREVGPATESIPPAQNGGIPVFEAPRMTICELKIYECLRQTAADLGHPDFLTTIRDVAGNVGLSPSTVHSSLRGLHARGLMTVSPSKRWTRITLGRKAGIAIPE